MLSHCLAAILYLSPLSPLTAAHYSILIYTTAHKYHVDPLLVISIIHLETGNTWKTTSKSKTHDYGLMQCHVSRGTNPSLLGKEKLLYVPRIGISYGVKSLVMWRNYHNRHCMVGKRHHYWAHYQWGYKVRSPEWSNEVNKLYHSLKNATQDNRLLAETEQ